MGCKKAAPGRWWDARGPSDAGSTLELAEVDGGRHSPLGWANSDQCSDFETFQRNGGIRSPLVLSIHPTRAWRKRLTSWEHEPGGVCRSHAAPLDDRPEEGSRAPWRLRAKPPARSRRLPRPSPGFGGTRIQLVLPARVSCRERPLPIKPSMFPTNLLRRARWSMLQRLGSLNLCTPARTGEINSFPCLGAPQAAPAVQALVARTVADRDRAALIARRGIALALGQGHVVGVLGHHEPAAASLGA
jgi:hypothetical protein